MLTLLDFWLTESVITELKPCYKLTDETVIKCTFPDHVRPHLRYFLLSNKLERFQFHCGKSWFEKHLKKFLLFVIHFIHQYQFHPKPFMVLPWHFYGLYVFFGKSFIIKHRNDNRYQLAVFTSCSTKKSCLQIQTMGLKRLVWLLLKKFHRTKPQLNPTHMPNSSLNILMNHLLLPYSPRSLPLFFKVSQPWFKMIWITNNNKLLIIFIWYFSINGGYGTTILSIIFWLG